jgi:hypothetical protein
MLFNLAHQLRMADESLARLRGVPMELGSDDLETLETAEVEPLSEELEELHTAEVEMLTAEVLEEAGQAEEEEEFLAPPELAPEAAAEVPSNIPETAPLAEPALAEQTQVEVEDSPEEDEPLPYPTGTDEVVGTGETVCAPGADALAEPEVTPEEGSPPIVLRPRLRPGSEDSPTQDPFALPEHGNLPDGFPYPETPTLSDVQAPPKRRIE